MNAAVTDAEPDEALLERVRALPRLRAWWTEVTVKEPRLLSCPRGSRASPSRCMDYGYKNSIADCLHASSGCAVTVYPAKTLRAETVLAAGHDGVMLSNGPGDPAENAILHSADTPCSWTNSRSSASASAIR